MWIEVVSILEETPVQKYGYAENGIRKQVVAGSTGTIAVSTPTPILTLDCSSFNSNSSANLLIKCRATEIASSAGYCSQDALIQISVTKQGGVLKVLGLPTAVWSQQQSVSAGFKTIAVALSASIASNIVTVSASLTPGGSNPATSGLLIFEAESMSTDTFYLSTV